MTKQPETQQTETTEPPLSPDERCRLARLALKLAYGDEPIWPDVVH
jgi:hypothetical protein